MILKKPKFLFNPLDKRVMYNAQLDMVAYAEHCHRRRNSFGEVLAALIGAGTGAGKTLTALGVYLNNYGNGRKVALWVSVNMDLMEGVADNMRTIGMNPDRLLLELPEPELGVVARREDGVYYTTYSTLIRQGRNGRRIDQVCDLLGGAPFDGVIVLDEGHKAGGKKGKMGGESESSQTGSIIMELMERLPNARFVVMSATLAQEPKNMAFLARRIGLVGTDELFASANQLVATLESGGVVLQEQFAAHLRRTLGYSTPMLSWDGVEFSTLAHSLTPDQVGVWNLLARAWQIVLRNMNSAMKITSASKNAAAKAFAAQRFWSAQQMFFRQVLSAMMVPTLIKSMESDLAAGLSVLVQIDLTGEATQNRRLSQASESDIDLNAVDLTPRDVLMMLVETAFPIFEYEAIPQQGGNVIYQQMMENGKPVVNQVALAMREKLLVDLATLAVPEHPLNQIINHFGADKVAEVTGRKSRIEIDANGLRFERKLKKSARLLEQHAFNSGKKPIIVFSSGAGGVGFSFNIPPRRHYVLDAGWSAVTAIQGLGRSHRINNTTPPSYVLMTTDIPAHKRFMSTVAKRMESLGALSRGQKNTSSVSSDDGELLSSDLNLENKYAEQAVDQLIGEISRGELAGFSADDLEQKMGLAALDKENRRKQLGVPVTRFLNRLMALEVDDMDFLWGEFERRMLSNIEYAKMTGTFETGISVLNALSIEVMDTKPIPGKPDSQYAALRVETAIEPRMFDQLPFNNPGLSFAEGEDQVVCLTPMRKITGADGKLIDSVKVYTPSHVWAENENEFTQKYRPVVNQYSTWQENEELRRRWNTAAKALPTTRLDMRHFVTGSLLTVWPLFHAEDRGKVFRIPMPNGDWIGKEIHPKFLADTLDAFGVNCQVAYTASDIARLIESGKIVYLQGNRNLRQVRSNNGKRWEITGLSQDDAALYEKAGVIKQERHQFQMRAYLNTGDEAAIARLMGRFNVVRVE